MSVEFQTWLATQMERQGLNNAQLGHKLGVSSVAVFRWLHGERQPDETSVAKLAEFFLVSRAEIYRRLGRLSEPPRDPYFEILESLWDRAPDWKKKDIVTQLRAVLEEQRREQAAREAQREEGSSEKGSPP